MSTFPARILLATDGSEDAALAAKAAVAISEMTGSELHVAHAWRSVTSARFEASLRTPLEQEGQKVLDDQVEGIRAAGGAVAGAHLRQGAPVEEILNLAEELGAGLLVTGSRGRGPVQRLLMGSVSDGVVHGASFPVLVMRGGEGAWPPERVIVGDDGSEEAKGAGEVAARIGKLFGANSLLVRAFPQLPDMDTEGRRSNARMVEDELRREEQAVLSRAKEIQGPLGVRPRVEIAVGDPAIVLLRAAEEDRAERTLIAVGSRGIGKARRMRLGSASMKVLHAAEGPVLVYPRPRS
jgi:nucleotide-binding universal stress UspA family protein